MPFAIIGDRIEWDGYHVATLAQGAPATVLQTAREVIELAEDPDVEELQQRVGDLEDDVRTLGSENEEIATALEACRSKRKAYAAILMVTDDEHDET